MLFVNFQLHKFQNFTLSYDSETIINIPVWIANDLIYFPNLQPKESSKYFNTQRFETNFKSQQHFMEKFVSIDTIHFFVIKKTIKYHLFC